MAEALREMTGPSEEFFGKYQGKEKIWSGKSFLDYLDYRTLLAELPVSAVAVPTRQYRRKFPGNRDYVYGELAYCLMGYEGYLRDKAYKVEECFIKPILGPGTFILQFIIRFQTATGEPQSWSCEVLRMGATKFILYVDYYRPM
jgi:hypothetical protein